MADDRRRPAAQTTLVDVQECKLSKGNSDRYLERDFRRAI
jgi:hypothetical protein